MRRKPMIFKQSAIYVALICASLLAAALAIANSAARSSHALTKTPATTTDPVTPPVAHSQNRLEAARVTLRPTGFEPEQITRPAGRFLLAVNDRSGKEDVTLLLVQGTGDRLNEVRMRERARKHEWRQVVNLPPGRYELREASNPEHVCQITITNN